MRNNVRVADGGSIRTEQAIPGSARRTWPQWLGTGVAMIAVPVVAVLWTAAGARLLLGALGLFLLVRGALLLRAGRAGALSRPAARSARRLGTAALAAGTGVLVVALASAELAAGILLVATPVALFAGGAALRASGGATARRGGAALLVWAALVTGLLALTLAGQGWERAAEVATVVTALAVALLGVPLLVAAVHLRTTSGRPAPAAPAGCAGCACGAGGCGS